MGINRRTIYRWLDSTTRVNRRFQKRIEQTRPADLLVDAAEQTIASTIASGDVPASIFTLKTKGKHRGWTEKPAEEDPLLIKVANAFRHWLSDFPDATVEERLIMLGRFASQGGVLRLELAKKLNIPIGK